MKKSRWIKLSVVVVAVIGALTLALVLTQGTSEAGGPGGRGRGNGVGSGAGTGAGNGAQGAYGQSAGTQAGQNGTTPLYQNQCEDCSNVEPQYLQQQNGTQGQNSNQRGGQQQGAATMNGSMNGTMNGGMNGAKNGGTQSQLGTALKNLPPAVPGEVPAEVVAALNAGIRDEYHAYTTYQAIIDEFGAVNPFVNIQQAEAQHIAALEIMFDRYDLPVPAPTAIDTVSFATLQDACAAGAAAEIANLNLYDSWMATVQDYPDMVQVFQALRDASEFSHLPAFENCAG